MSIANQINVVVLNKAGKVGKSTLSKHLISPRLNGRWIQVETFNHSGHGAMAKVSGRKFGYVAEAVAASTGSKCIDIGSSNYEAAKREMQQIDGFVDEIDFWIVPCKESAGVINDSLSTVAELINDLRVDPNRIVVIPNQIERPEEGLEGFSSVVRAATHFNFHFCPVPVVANPKFDVFNDEERSVIEIAADDVDYVALIAAELDLDRRAKLAEQKVLQGRARYLSRHLADVWTATPLAKLAVRTHA